jgi:hypothetical protein
LNIFDLRQLIPFGWINPNSYADLRAFATAGAAPMIRAGDPLCGVILSSNQYVAVFRPDPLSI